jgi:hypothetical protein
MSRSKTRFRQLLVGCCALLLASATYALPALQLGPTFDPATGWTYNNLSDTWDYTGAVNSTAYVSAFANATTGNGAYAWDTDGTAQWAYLVVSTVPKLPSGTDYFDINIGNVSGATLVTSGWGQPPLEDSNSLPDHGIFDTYFEIYQFKFDGPLGTITNTQPPPDPLNTGAGYNEAFAVTINSKSNLVTGLHFDLFTTTGAGNYADGWAVNKNLVYANAPFSHDAQWNPTPPIVTPPDTNVPVPGTLLLVGLALVGLAWLRRRRSC